MRITTILVGVAAFIGIEWWAVCQWNTPAPPPAPINQHAARLRRLAQQATQLANEAEAPPLPVAPANAVALSNAPMAMPSPLAVKSFRTAHPSGAVIDVSLPTNMVAIQIPYGYYLTNRMVHNITLDEFSDFKRTNGSAVIWYFKRQ